MDVWDTPRCAYPLQTIIEPAENMKAIQGFIKDYETSGWLTDSGAMIGHHSTAVIVDAYRKGLRDFDVNKAYEAMKKRGHPLFFASLMGVHVLSHVLFRTSRDAALELTHAGHFRLAGIDY